MKTDHEWQILKKLVELNGKYKVNHQGKDDGRPVTTALIKIAGNYYIGSAMCSHHDQFDRKIGRAIALGRAYENYCKNTAVITSQLNPAWLFKEDIKK